MTDDELAWSIAERARKGEQHAAKLLAELFAARRDFGVERRKQIAETTYGLLRRHDLLARVAHDRAGMLAERARLDRGGAITVKIDDDEERVAVLGSLPRWLAARLIADFGVAEAEALATALASPPGADVRCNPMRADRDALLTALRDEGIVAHALPRTTYGARLDDAARDLFATRAFRDGLFEVQDEGSQLVAELVAPSPGALIVDACAGEGGKTLAIAGMLGNKGRVIACDVSERKIEALRKRARRAGLSNVQAMVIEREGPLPEVLQRHVGRVDRVLIDAPCSGVGTLRRNPELRYRLDEAAPSRLASEQRAIARRFTPLVARGGRLIYATCTVLREEDEGTLDAIIAETDLRPMRAAEIWGTQRALPITDATGTNLRLFPHRHGTDGFFAGVLRRPR